MVVPRARCVDLNIRSSAASQDHRQADGSSPDRACVQHEDFILRIASPSEGRGSALRCFPTPRILDVGRDRGNESTSPSCSARSGSSVRRATSIGDRGDGFSPVNLIPSWCKSSSSRTAAVPSRLRGRTTRSTNAILSSTTSSAWRPPVRGSGSRPSATRCVTSSRNDGFTPRKYAGSEHCGPRRGLSCSSNDHVDQFTAQPKSAPRRPVRRCRSLRRTSAAGPRGALAQRPGADR